MRYFLVVLLVLTTMIYSCVSRNKIPSDIIPPDQMSDVLFDLSMAEGFVENYHSKDSAWVKDSILITEVDKLLAIRNISQEKFKESYDFYKLHPPLFKKLVDTAYERAQRSRSVISKRPVAQ